MVCMPRYGDATYGTETQVKHHDLSMHICFMEIWAFPGNKQTGDRHRQERIGRPPVKAARVVDLENQRDVRIAFSPKERYMHGWSLSARASIRLTHCRSALAIVSAISAACASSSNCICVEGNGALVNPLVCWQADGITRWLDGPAAGG